MIELKNIVQLLDTELRINDIHDAPQALNGLQIENYGEVSRVAIAVDGSQKSIDDAISISADLLILHHGIFWSGLRPITGWWKKKIESCLDHNLAVYAAHLPLDIHPTLGNNAGIAEGLGLTNTQAEVDYHGCLIGLAGDFDGSVAELKRAYAKLTDTDITGIIHDDFSPAGRIAICSGGGADAIYQIHSKGYKCYLTGEENHWVRNAAEDIGMNILFAGHYATETFGVKKLGQLIHEKFKLPVHFIDNRTGM